MKSITYLRGDATSPQVEGNKIIAHICNDLGGWGKGFVLAISKRWPEPEAAYRQWYRERARNDFGLGAIQVIAVESNLWVANLIGQHGIKASAQGAPIRYEAVAGCLQKLAEVALQCEATIHMPRIGCGLAGGKWERIEPIILQTLLQQGIAVYVYDLV